MHLDLVIDTAALGSFALILLVAPWFLAYGLVKTAYVATEALGALSMHLTKTLAYGTLALMTTDAVLLGLAMSPAMIAGSYIGKRIVGRMPERAFEIVIEIVLIVAGAQFLLQ